MDTSIRHITPRESLAIDAEAAAQRFIATGVDQPNPKAGEPDEAVWLAIYRRCCLRHDEGESPA
jgi:hypothetical protein